MIRRKNKLRKFVEYCDCAVKNHANQSDNSFENRNKNPCVYTLQVNAYV